MDLPLLPPVKPMLAKASTKVPTAEGMYYEPKWDGFRCIVFRDGDEVELGSRNERPLTRYFPEVVEAVKAALPERCVGDGEVAVSRGGGEGGRGSRNERPLTRYFPEVVEAVKAALPERCVVDGEIVVPQGDRLHFESLLQRIHPAQSRVDLLAEQTPASFVAFDLLALGDESLVEVPFAQRQARLREVVTGTDSVHVTAITQDA